MKTILRVGAGLVLLGVASIGFAEPFPWQVSPLRLGHVDVINLSWGIERTLGVTRAASEFVMPIQLVWDSREESTGLFGPQFRSPQLESRRLFARSETVLEWQTPWGESLALQKSPGSDRYTGAEGQWTAIPQGDQKYTLTRKDGWRLVYEKGYLQEITAPHGRKLVFRYQNQNLLTSVVQVSPTDSEWPVVQLSTDAATGRAQSLTVGGVESRFAFVKGAGEDALRLASWSRGAVPAEKFEYGKGGVLSAVTSPSGKRLVFQVSFEAWPKDQARGGAASVNTETPSRSVLVADGIFRYAYTAGRDKGHPLYDKGVEIKDRLGRTQNANLHHRKGVLELTDTAGKTTTIQYARRDGSAADFKRHNFRVCEVTNPWGEVVVRNAFDAEGKLVGTTDRLGNVTQYTYDEKGRIVKVARIVGGRGEPEIVATLGYDQRGNLIRSADALGQATEFRYNTTGDLVGVTDVEGGSHESTRDERGFVSSLQDPLGRIQKLEYDTHGRLVPRISVDGVITEVVRSRGSIEVRRLLPGASSPVMIMKQTIDPEKHALLTTDALGRINRNDYSAEGRLIAATNPGGIVTRYKWDEKGGLMAFWLEKTSEKDSMPMAKVMFQRDSDGRLIKQINANGQETTWAYDKRGRLSSKTTGTQIVQYTYNKLGQIIVVDYGHGNLIRYDRDALNRVTTVRTPTSDARYFYDKLGRVKEIKLARGERQAHLQYGYTPSGKRASVAWQDGNKPGRTEYLYRNGGSLAEIKKDGNTIATYMCDARGLITEKRMADGTKCAYENDALGRIATLKVLSGRGKTLTELKYVWDAGGQLSKRTWDGTVQDYTYDPAGQLTGATSSEPNVIPSERYSYDIAGNMIEKTLGNVKTRMSYDAANRLVASTQESQTGNESVVFEYDAAGRLSAELAGKEMRRYEYGLFENVEAVVKSDGSKVTFDYWPNRQVAAKMSTAVNQSVGQPEENEGFLWDGLALLRQGGRAFTIEPNISGGVPMLQTAPNQQMMLLSDICGTTIGAIQGEVFIPAKMSAFAEPCGVQMGISENSSVGVGTRTPPQFFTGKPWDNDLGAYTFVFRNYTPRIARWAAADPIGFPNGLNNYLCANNSIQQRPDPLGLFYSGTPYAGWDVYPYNQYQDEAAWSAGKLLGSSTEYPMAAKAMNHADGGSDGYWYLDDFDVLSVRCSDAYFNDFIPYIKQQCETFSSLNDDGVYDINSSMFGNHGISFAGVDKYTDVYYGLGSLILGTHGTFTIIDGNWEYDATVDIVDKTWSFLNYSAVGWYTPTIVGYRLESHGYIHSFQVDGSWSELWME